MWIRKAVRDARKGVDSPVPTQVVSNEEFIPRPQNSRQKQVEQLIGEMRFFAERMKMVVEPTGCLGLAAVRADRARFRGKRIGIVISGGNVDISRFSTLLAN